VPIDVTNAIVIDRPVDVVAAYASDPAQAPVWYVNIQTVEWETPRPLRVGSRLAFVAKFMGRRMAYTYEVVDWVPGVRFTMRTSEGPFPMETTYTWELAGDSATRMTLRNRGTPVGLGRLTAPFMAFAVRLATRKDLALLKEVLEAPRS
jgi:hypothetical protein